MSCSVNKNKNALFFTTVIISVHDILVVGKKRIVVGFEQHFLL